MKLALSLTAHASSDEEKVKALYSWVAKHIRYISTTVNDGGLVPRDVSYILRNGFGDCKDHVVMLESLLKAVGIESTAALINLGAAFELPEGPVSFSPTNHVMTYIPAMDLYLDSTAQFVPFGKLDDQALDKPTILVALNRLGHTPKMRAEDNKLISKTPMTIRADGSVVGANESRMTGTTEINNRLLRFQQTGETMENIVRNALYRFNEIGSGNITFTAPWDLEKAYQVGSTFELETIANFSSPGAFTVPVGVAPGRIAEMTIYKPLENRDFPYVCESENLAEEYILTLPENIQINSLPKNVNHSVDHIRYESRYDLQGSILKVYRNIVFDYPNRQCTTEKYKQLVNTYKVMRADHRALVMFTPRLPPT